CVMGRDIITLRLLVLKGSKLFQQSRINRVASPDPRPSRSGPRRLEMAGGSVSRSKARPNPLIPVDWPRASRFAVGGPRALPDGRGSGRAALSSLQGPEGER